MEPSVAIIFHNPKTSAIFKFQILRTTGVKGNYFLLHLIRTLRQVNTTKGWSGHPKEGIWGGHGVNQILALAEGGEPKVADIKGFFG